MGIFSRSKPLPESTVLSGRIAALESECETLRSLLADQEREAIDVAGDESAYASACGHVATIQASLTAKLGILARMRDAHREAHDRDKSAYLEKLGGTLERVRAEQIQEFREIRVAEAEEEDRHKLAVKSLKVRKLAAERMLAPIESEIELARGGLLESEVAEVLRLRQERRDVSDALKPLQHQRNQLMNEIDRLRHTESHCRTSFPGTPLVASAPGVLTRSDGGAHTNAMSETKQQREKAEGDLSKIESKIKPLTDEVAELTQRINAIKGE